MTEATRLRIGAGLCAAAGAAAIGVSWLKWHEVRSVPVFTCFFVVQVVSWYSALRSQPTDAEVKWQFHEAILVASLLMLGPVETVLLFALGIPVGHLTARGSKPGAAINGGQDAVVALAAAFVAHGLGLVAGELSVGAIVAVLVGATVFAVVSDVIAASLFCWIDGFPFAKTLVGGLRMRVARSPVIVSLGLLAGAAGVLSTWAALFVLPPLAAIHHVLAEHLQAKRDRERAEELFESSVAVHASVRVSEVEEAICSAAARLARCQNATISADPPGTHEYGVPLNLQEERWLVVSGKLNGALGADAQRLLKAFAAVASSALENARLVKQIEQQALHDDLTDLANQVLFDDRVAQAAAAARRNRERFAVMMLDLDHFKKVNDSLGHSAGNELLRVVAERLVESSRDIDTVARLGSDHFTLLLPGVGTSETVGVIAEKLLAAIRRPIELDGHELFMTASVGTAVFPEDGTKSEHLLRNADSAMHRAKEMGRDTYRMYASGMNDLAQLRLVRESELHNAVLRNELRLRYQPQIDLRTGKIVGVEALVRWEHPVLGLIGPAEFVPLAEESGLIVAVDHWVLHEACRQAKQWFDEGLPAVRVAVNISGRHFHASERLVDAVERTLGLTGLPSEWLELEVTEGIAVGEEEVTAKALNQIRDIGVKLAIDDFGTGYSMLGRLRSYPIDRLKIDRSFVSEIESHHAEAPIVSAMIAMARSLKIECVAEGVETLEQQIFLRNHGCDQAQGFLYSHPVEADEFARLMRTPSTGLNLTSAV
jgi:diguanylate cyclase (GGDEF)-like protein